jgi:hypothetical protein
MAGRRGYYAFITTRSPGGWTFRETLGSLLRQTVKPERILVYNNGSEEPEGLPDGVECISRFHPYDIRRVAGYWNEMLERTPRWVFAILFSSDDAAYPPEYMERMLGELSDGRTAVVSGSRGFRASPDGFQLPEGHGRVVRADFLEEVGWRIPEVYGYESWMCYEALRRGYGVRRLEDVGYVHLRLLGMEHGLADWGISMRCLGYYPPFVLLRWLYNLAARRREFPARTILRVLLDYALAPLRCRGDPYYGRYPDHEELTKFVSSMQRRRLRTAILSIPNRRRNRRGQPLDGGEPRRGNLFKPSAD